MQPPTPGPVRPGPGGRRQRAGDDQVQHVLGAGPVGHPADAATPRSVHTPPGARSPELKIGEAGSGLPRAGRPRVSMRSSLPASDPAADPSPPAFPVATSSEPSTSTPSAPPLFVAPARDPDQHRLGRLPGGDAHHPVVGRACSRRRRRAGPRRSRGRAPARSARRPRSGRWARSRPAPGPMPRCTRSTRPVARSATSAERPSGSTAIALTGSRQVATTCGSGSTQPDGGAPPWSPRCSGGGGGVLGSGTTGGPAELAGVLQLLPPVARAVVREGGAAGQQQTRAASRRPRATPVSPRPQARAGGVSGR